MNEQKRDAAAKFADKHWPHADDWRQRSGAIAGYIQGQADLLERMEAEVEKYTHPASRLGQQMRLFLQRYRKEK